MKINKNGIIVVVIAFVVILALWFAYQILNSQKNVIEVSNIEDTTVTMESYENDIETTMTSEIKVYITGEVKKAGVYSAYDGDRICDVVEKAGGLTDKADIESVNMAEYVKDEEHIKIGNINDINKQTNDNNSNSEGKTAKYNVSANYDISVNTGNGIININTASAEELKTLKGIGDTIAGNIIEYRNSNGNFKNIEEIKKVSRIGDKLFEKIKPYITV